jgi:hypothetical protein
MGVLLCEKDLMNHIGLSSVLTFLTTGTLGFFVYFRNRQSKLYFIFFLYCLSISFWSLFVTIQVLTGVKWIAFASAKTLNAVAAFIPVFFLHFLKEFFHDPPGSWSHRLLPGLYGVATTFMVLSWANLLIRDVAPKYDLSYLMVPSPSYIFLIVFFCLFRGVWLAPVISRVQDRHRCSKKSDKIFIVWINSWLHWRIQQLPHNL